MEFKGKKVLITGASRGIGRATAIAFANKGACVGVHYKNNLKEAKHTLSLLRGTDHRLFQHNLEHPTKAEALIMEFTKHYGSLDILVNNAGIGEFHAIDEVDFDVWSGAWEAILNTNLLAVAHTSYWAVKEMIRQGGGRIVNVSSRGAYRGEPQQPAYGASKAALNSLTQSLAKQLAKHSIYVAGVAPGFTDTDMAREALTPEEHDRLMEQSPFKRMARPEEVAHAILFLASETAAYSSGTILDVNGASYFR